MLIEECTIDGCGRRVSAAGLCATHRRRKRLQLPMYAPIRQQEITLSDVLTAAWDVQDADGDDGEFERRVRRFRRKARKWMAACP